MLAFALLTSVQLPQYLSVLHLVFLFSTFCSICQFIGIQLRIVVDEDIEAVYFEFE